MGIHPDTFKRIKPKAEEELNKGFRDIETEVEVKIPKSFLSLMYNKFEAVYPNNQEEYLELVASTNEDLTSLIEHLQLVSKKLDPPCRDLIDKLIIELYSETNGHGIGSGFWAHIPKIWNLYRVVSDLDNINLNDVSTEFWLNQILLTYMQAYEFTILFLIDITRKIAWEKRKRDVYSKKFLKLYRKKKVQGRTISRGELSHYLDTQEFLNGWQCKVVQDPYIRNKIAHSDYYYDEESGKLVFGNRTCELEDLKAVLDEIYFFDSYLVLKYLQEGGFVSQLDKLSKLIEPVNMSEETGDSASVSKTTFSDMRNDLGQSPGLHRN